ncbi:hypothetical protein DSO57_1036032 [Entomophthora muscae]|uniref:Uncharacterized protein n=1 Tax=Entomophthora muscae TaxID=34485 RepID=A0ACC2S1A0_9FUNG|nr:hypothetical protein DSO57_1036032 [Entomophthora muscae]
MGTLGMGVNLLLVIALFRTRTGWNRLNLQMVGPIAGLDFIAALLVVLKNLVSLVIGNSELLLSNWFCSYIGTPLLLLPSFSMVLIAAMTIDRYCLVVHSHGINCIYGWIVCFVIGFILAGLLITNTVIHGIEADLSLTYCRPSGSSTLSFVAHRLATLIILLGLVVVNFCYIAIYLHCRRNLTLSRLMPRRYMLILVAYQICWLPKFITSLWGLIAKQSTIPKFLGVIGPLGLILLLFVNPCLVIGFQASLRKEVFSLLSRKKDNGGEIQLAPDTRSRYSTLP